MEGKKSDGGVGGAVLSIFYVLIVLPNSTILLLIEGIAQTNVIHCTVEQFSVVKKLRRCKTMSTKRVR